MTVLTFRRLDDSTWPGEFTDPDERETSRFSASWGTVLAHLEREVALTAGEGPADPHTPAVLEVAVRKRDLWADGHGVLADAPAPRHPGVALSFETLGGTPIRLASDQYDGNGRYGYLPGWQANVRAIALTLEALRAVDRYGCSRRGEQYQGFAALGSGEATPLGAGMTRPEAVRILADAAGGIADAEVVLADASAVAAAYRVAARAHHPDHGGNADAFATITAARDVLLA